MEGDTPADGGISAEGGVRAPPHGSDNFFLTSMARTERDTPAVGDIPPIVRTVCPTSVRIGFLKWARYARSCAGRRSCEGPSTCEVRPRCGG